MSAREQLSRLPKEAPTIGLGDLRRFTGQQLRQAPEAEPRYLAPYSFHCWMIDSDQRVVEASLSTFDRPIAQHESITPLADRTWVQLWKFSDQRRLIQMLSNNWPLKYTGRQPDYIYLPGFLLNASTTMQITPGYIEGWRTIAGYSHQQGGLTSQHWDHVMQQAPSLVAG